MLDYLTKANDYLASVLTPDQLSWAKTFGTILAVMMAFLVFKKVVGWLTTAKPEEPISAEATKLIKLMRDSSSWSWHPDKYCITHEPSQLSVVFYFARGKYLEVCIKVDGKEEQLTGVFSRRDKEFLRIRAAQVVDEINKRNAAMKNKAARDVFDSIGI